MTHHRTTLVVSVLLTTLTLINCHSSDDDNNVRYVSYQGLLQHCNYKHYCLYQGGYEFSLLVCLPACLLAGLRKN